MKRISLAEQADREQFADLVRQTERFKPHEHKADCELAGACALQNAIDASSDRIATEGALLRQKYSRNKS